MKSKNTAAWLSVFTGMFGVQWLYLEKGLFAGLHIAGLLLALIASPFSTWLIMLLPMIAGVAEGIYFLGMDDEAFEAEYNRSQLIAVPHAERPAVPQKAGPVINVNVQTGAPAAATDDVDVTEKLEKLHALKEKGVLTEEEFAAQKARLLG